MAVSYSFVRSFVRLVSTLEVLGYRRDGISDHKLAMREGKTPASPV